MTFLEGSNVREKLKRSEIWETVNVDGRAGRATSSQRMDVLFK